MHLSAFMCSWTEMGVTTEFFVRSSSPKTDEETIGVEQ
jgi:hypothetical protein